LYIYTKPCYAGSLSPRQGADGGDGLQIWRISANILNKQSQTADNGWSSSLGVSEGLTTPNRKNKLATKCYIGPRNSGPLWTR